MRKLNDRMKSGELYVVYGGVSNGGMTLVCYGDPRRTPRIYRKGAVDSRIGDHLPICKTFATAARRLKSIHHVLLPLSQMVRFWGPRSVKLWAKAQREIDPSEVLIYVRRLDIGA